jgi:hypothetical protein
MANFLAVGGIRAIASDAIHNSADAGRAFADSGAQIACICSSDQVYAELAEATAGALAAAGARRVLLAGRPSSRRRCAQLALMHSCSPAAMPSPCSPVYTRPSVSTPEAARTPLHTGGCQCGAVRFAVYAEPRKIGICHLPHVQKAVAGPFAVLAEVPWADFA